MGGEQGVLSTVRQGALEAKGKPLMTDEQKAAFEKPILDKYEKKEVPIIPLQDCGMMVLYLNKPGKC